VAVNKDFEIHVWVAVISRVDANMCGLTGIDEMSDPIEECLMRVSCTIKFVLSPW
jgi:hypothetical protein